MENQLQSQSLFINNHHEVSCECSNGLGDKMLDFIGFYIICKYLGCKSYIKFNDGGQFAWGDNTYDLRLFQEFGDVIVSDKICPFYIKSHNPSASLCPYRTFKFLRQFFPNITFEQVSKDFEIYGKQLIRPSDIILQNIPEGIETTYGIHLRKSDKITNHGDIRHENPCHEFDIIIDNLLQDVTNIIVTESSPSFLLVSEDSQWKNEIQMKIQSIADMHQKQVQFLEHNYSSANDYKNYHSVMDMFCLSKCKEIIQGVKYSTFSILAALIGNKKLRNYSKNLDSDHLCIIYSWNSVVELNGKLNFDTNMHEKITERVKYLETNISV